MPIVCSTLRSNTVYLILFILISAVLPLSAPSEFISSRRPICTEAQKWPSFCFALKNSTLLSVRAQEELTRREGRAREMFCDMAKLLTRIDCNQPYSVNLEQSLQCQEAYRDWACSIIAESGEDESGEDDSGKDFASQALMPFPSCDSVCHRVLRVCPYLTPDRSQVGPTGTAALHPSQYGGHPAFYCSRRSALLFTALMSQYPEQSTRHQYFYLSGSEVNLTDELISNNDTSCCWTYSAALKTEQFPESSHSNEEHQQFPGGIDRRVIPSAKQLSENQVQIQCLHVQHEILINKEDNFVDGTYGTGEEYSENSDFVVSGVGGASVVVEGQRNPPSKLALSRAIKADMVATIVETGTGNREISPVVTTGDSSEANYYLHDDWFEVSSHSSKSIQKRNNYNNFLSLVSSSKQSSSVLSSGEEDDPDNVYNGGPVEEDTDVNDGLVSGGGVHRHQSELEQGGTSRRRDENSGISRRRRRRQDLATTDNNEDDEEEEDDDEFTSMDDEESIRVNKRSIGQPKSSLPSNVKLSAKSSASRQQLFIHFPISLPITIHHNRCFPVLLLLLLIMILLLLLLLLMVLLTTTNFLPILLLYTTNFVSSTLVQRNNDEDKKDRINLMENDRGGDVTTVIPISSNHCEYHQKIQNLMMMNLPQRKNNKKYNNYNMYVTCGVNNVKSSKRMDLVCCSCCCSYDGTILLKHSKTVVRSQTSQYLVYVMIKLISSKSKVQQDLIGNLNKLKKWFIEWLVTRVTNGQKCFLKLTTSMSLKAAAVTVTISSVTRAAVVDVQLVKKNIILNFWRKPFQKMKSKLKVMVDCGNGDVVIGGGSGYNDGIMRLDDDYGSTTRSLNPISRLHFVVHRVCENFVLEQLLLSLLFLLLILIFNLIRTINTLVKTIMTTTTKMMMSMLRRRRRKKKKKNTIEKTIMHYCSVSISTSTVTVINILTKNSIKQTCRGFARPLLHLVLLLLLLLLILLIPRLKLLILLLTILMPIRFILSSVVQTASSNESLRGQSILSKTA